jgi:hypothetical protein
MGEGKLRDLRHTTSDALEILRQLANPDAQRTLQQVKETATTVKGITETLATPEWNRNLENMLQMSAEMNAATSRIESLMTQLRESGIVDDVKITLNSARAAMDLMGREESGVKGKDVRDLVLELKLMLGSLKQLMDELALTAADSRKTGIIRDLGETKRRIDDTRRIIKEEIEP